MFGWVKATAHAVDYVILDTTFLRHKILDTSGLSKES